MKILDTNVLIDLDRHAVNFETGIEKIAFSIYKRTFSI